METWGNKRANQLYEANLPNHVQGKSREDWNVREMKNFIRDKWEFKKFKGNADPPPAERIEDASKAAKRGTVGAGGRAPTRKSIPNTQVAAAPAPASVAKKEPSLLDFLDDMPSNPTPAAAPAPVPQNVFGGSDPFGGASDTFSAQPSATAPAAPQNAPFDPFAASPAPNQPTQQNQGQQNQGQGQMGQQQQPQARPSMGHDAILGLFNTAPSGMGMGSQQGAPQQGMQQPQNGMMNMQQPQNGMMNQGMNQGRPMGMNQGAPMQQLQHMNQGMHMNQGGMNQGQQFQQQMPPQQGQQGQQGMQFNNNMQGQGQGQGMMNQNQGQQRQQGFQNSPQQYQQQGQMQQGQMPPQQGMQFNMQGSSFL